MRFQSILACVAASPLLMGAAEPVRLPAISPWVLDYADESCRLARKFGTEADPTLLLFESPSPGTMSMLAMGKPLGGVSKKVTAQFLPGGYINEGQPARSGDGKKPAALWSSVSIMPAKVAIDLKEKWEAEWKRAKKGERPPSTDLAEREWVKRTQQTFAATVTGVAIEARRNRPVVLETGSIGRAMTMLEQCTKDQLRYWGVDPAIEEKIVRRTWAADLYQWFGPNDYPASALSRGQQSVVAYRLLVDATGKPTKCTPLSHVDAPAFQKTVCNVLMKRARLQPAELADGTKVPSYYTSSVQWRME